LLLTALHRGVPTDLPAAIPPCQNSHRVGAAAEPRRWPDARAAL